jgi:hypothetical protein
MNTGTLLTHLTFALLLFLLIPTRRLGLGPKARLVLLGGAAAASLITVDGLSLGDYTRSYTDDLAITSLLWFTWCVLSRVHGSEKLPPRHHLQLVLCFGLMFLFLYPATLGVAQLDPYRLGFSPAPLLIAMWCLCLWLWWQRNYLALGLIVLATGAYLLDVKDSDNYWDYLIDPLLSVYSLACLLKYSWQRKGKLPLLKRGGFAAMAASVPRAAQLIERQGVKVQAKP